MRALKAIDDGFKPIGGPDSGKVELMKACNKVIPDSPEILSQRQTPDHREIALAKFDIF